MKLAAMPISAIGQARGRRSGRQGWSRAAPATASTLSSDIDTSAMTIWVTACAQGLSQSACRRSCHRRRCPRTSIASGSPCACAVRATSSSTPTAAGRRRRAEGRRSARSWVVDERKDDAQHRGGEDADQDGLGALFGWKAGGGEADDDGIVAGQHQVDHDHR